MIRNVERLFCITAVVGMLAGCSFQINLSDNKPVTFYASDLSGSWYRYEEGKRGKSDDGVEEIILRKVGNLTYRTEGHKRYTINSKPEKQELANVPKPFTYDSHRSESEPAMIAPIYDITFLWEGTEMPENNDTIKTVRGEQLYDSKVGKAYVITTEGGSDVLVDGDEKWYRSKDKVFKVIEDKKTEILKQVVADNNKKYPMGTIEIGKVRYIGK